MPPTTTRERRGRTKADPYLDSLIASMSENQFQARVITCARANGWRIDIADVHPAAQKHSPTPLHDHLKAWLGKIPLRKVYDFLVGKKQQLFTFAYHTHDSRYSQGGYPDLTLVHPNNRRVIFAELKKRGGYPSTEQRLWLAALSCALEYTPNVSVHLWDPDDWPEIVEALGGIDTGLKGTRNGRKNS